MPLKLRRRGRIWYLRGTVRGIPVDESTKTADEAVAEAVRIKRESALLHRSVFGSKGTVTFLEAVTDYLERGAGASDKRYIAILLERFKLTALSKIDQDAVDRAAMDLYPNATAETRNRQVYTPMAAILHHAASRGKVEWLHLQRPKMKKGRNRAVSQDVATRLIAGADDEMRAFLICLFYTGRRVTELVNLTWEDGVDLRRRALFFNASKTDTDEGAPMHPEVFDILASRPGKRDGKVFRYRDRGEVYDALAPLRSELGVAFTPHQARHSFATWLRQAGYDIKLVMEAGGWRDIKSVLRYQHVEKREVRGAIAELPSLQNPGSRKRKKRAADIKVLK